MRNHHRLTGTLAALGLLTVTSLAAASSHKEAPAISFDPAADNTDLWAWTDKAPATTVWVVASYNPLEEPNGGPNFAKFADGVLYQIHVARGDTSLADAITYNIQFTTGAITPLALGSLPKGGGGGTVGGGQEFFAQLAGNLAQTYTVTKIVTGNAPVVVASGTVAPPNIGPRTDFVVYGGGAAGGYSKGATAFMDSFVSTAGSDGTTAWAGPSDDAFYVDLARTFDLASFAGSAPTPNPDVARNGVAGYNVHTIALAIPVANLLATGQTVTAGTPGNPAANDPQTLGIWASASRRKVRILRANGTEESYGPWTQVSRLGFPLVNEAVIGVQDKDRYNRTSPATDLTNFGPYFLNPVIVQDAIAVGVYPAATGAAFATGRTDIVDVVGANNIPAFGSHNFGGFVDEDAAAGTTVGDVLRLDLGFTSGFPNGRPLGADGGAAYTATCYLTAIDPKYCGTNQNQESTQVSDAILSAFITKFTSVVAQGATHNDINYQVVFPFVAPPWAGSDQGHGCADTDVTFPCRQ